VPVLSETWDFVKRDIVPGGTRRNLTSVEGLVEWSERLDPEYRLVLADAQTSGGLLIAVDPAAAEALLEELHGHGVAAATAIGGFTNRAGRIEIV
jgi:selenide,water dikinase